MSVDAIGYVFKHSPFKGATFQVHLALADSVNDQFDYEFWMYQANLARKARVGRQAANKALAALVEAEMIELLEVDPGGANLYRFLQPSAPYVYGEPPKKGARRKGTGSKRGRQGGVLTGDNGVSSTATQNPSRDPNQEPKQNRATAEAPPPPPPPPLDARARCIVAAIWKVREDAGEPVPANYNKTFAAIAGMLRAGWPDADVQRAAMKVPTISIGWIETELKRGKPTNTASGPRWAPAEDDDAARRAAPAGRIEL